MKLSQATIGLFSSLLLHSSSYFVGAENVRGGAADNINIPLEEAHKRFAKIIDGTEVESRDEYPWFVSLTATYDNTLNPQPFCGGQLKSPTFVLTAAHCVSDFPPPDGNGSVYPPQAFTVFVGAYAQPFRSDNNAEERRIRSVFTHPNWDGQLSINNGWDFALLELDEESTKTPVKLDLDGVSDGLQGGEEVWAAGFGLTTPGGNVQPDKLMEVKLAHVKTRYCQGDIICANGPGDKNICQGDSGGPLYSEELGLLLGVTSFTLVQDINGVRACDPTVPAGWARVSAAADWIKETVNDLTEGNNNNCSSDGSFASEYTLPAKFGSTNYCYRIQQAMDGGKLFVDTSDPGCANYEAGSAYNGVPISNYQGTEAVYEGAWSGSISLALDLDPSSSSEPTFNVSGDGKSKTFSGTLTVPTCSNE